MVKSKYLVIWFPKSVSVTQYLIRVWKSFTLSIKIRGEFQFEISFYTNSFKLYFFKLLMMNPFLDRNCRLIR